MLDQGLSGLIIEYDLPTTNGYDSDHPLAAGEVGRAGTAIDTLADMEAALDFPFDKLRHLTSVCNGPQPVNLAMILAALEKKGVDPRVVHAADAQRDPDRVHVRGPLHLPARARAADRDGRDRVRDPQPPELAPDLGGERAALRRAREPGAGARLRLLDRDAVPRQRARARASRSTRSRRTSASSPGVDMDFFEAVGKLRAYRKIWARLHEGALRRADAASR